MDNLLTYLIAHGSEHHAEPVAKAANAINYNLVTLHPMVVHLPIGLLMATIAFEFLFLVRKNVSFRFASRAAFVLGCLGATAALASGFLADSELGHGYAGHDLAHTHRNIMITSTAIWVIATIALIKFRAFLEGSRFLHFFLYAVTAALFFFGAHIGGELVYDHAVGIKSLQKNESGTR